MDDEETSIAALEVACSAIPDMEVSFFRSAVEAVRAPRGGKGRGGRGGHPREGIRCGLDRGSGHGTGYRTRDSRSCEADPAGAEGNSQNLYRLPVDSPRYAPHNLSRIPLGPMSAQAEPIHSSARPLPDARAFEHAAFRACERLAAGASLCALAPVLGLTGLLVAMLSRRSPLIGHLRVGLNGEPFWLLKFRTMWGTGAQATTRSGLVEFIKDDNGPSRKSATDPRVTGRFARLLRRTSIDELPQLVHVLTGRMSLVGPRPLTRTELDVHYGEHAAEVLRVRPGLTGLWQVMGRNRLTYRQRRRLDLFYVRRQSAAVYLMVLARTVPLLLIGKDSW